MKKVTLSLLVLAGALISSQAFAEERCERVVEIGNCWSGFQAIVATMENGDQLFLGDLNSEDTKIRNSLALVSKTTGEKICYQANNPQNICSVIRSPVEWWILGGSIF